MILKVGGTYKFKKQTTLARIGPGGTLTCLKNTNFLVVRYTRKSSQCYHCYDIFLDNGIFFLDFLDKENIEDLIERIEYED